MLDLAKLVSTWSKDPSTKVGAVITDRNNRVISLGFNGFPSKCIDHPDHYSDRKIKLEKILHAERNALIFSKRDLSDCIIYTYPFAPCATCASMIIQAGITTVIAPKMTDEIRERWQESLELAERMYNEASVEFVEINYV